MFVNSGRLLQAAFCAALLWPAAVQAERDAVHLSLVLDISASVERNGAFADLKKGAAAFVVDYFDDFTDCIGLVTFSTTARVLARPRMDFTLRLSRRIASLDVATDTNLQEGLHAAQRQLDRATGCLNNHRVVVLFTDASPTAFSARLFIGGDNRQWFRGALAAYVGGSGVRGLFRLRDGAKVIGFAENGEPITAPNSSTHPSPIPRRLPGNRTVTGENIRSLGVERAEARAFEIRESGYTIYVVGLVNPDAELPSDIADAELLRRIANEDGIVDTMQPAGKAIIVTDPTLLADAFATIAQEVLDGLH